MSDFLQAFERMIVNEGGWGCACIVIDRDSWHKGPLIAHEKCHQSQMARDGIPRMGKTRPVICTCALTGLSTATAWMCHRPLPLSC